MNRAFKIAVIVLAVIDPGTGMGQQGVIMSCPCEEMMKKGMVFFPWLAAMGSLFGLLAIAALALLVILEILWIRHWSRRLKQGAP